jgi:3',5'-cyclic-AMP phosphodiesterase
MWPGTLKLALDKINAMPGRRPDAAHRRHHQSSKPAEFDTAQQIIKGPRRSADFLCSRRARYRNRRRRSIENGSARARWARLVQLHPQGRALHRLNNSLQVDALGKLGAEQLSWLKADLAHPLSASTPIVVFAHIPLWMVYPEWGWGTQDGAEALSYLKRFGSVTVLNGHIHQVVQKVEGQRRLPYRDVDGVSSARARRGSERRDRWWFPPEAEERSGRHRGPVHREAQPPGRCRFLAGG